MAGRQRQRGVTLVELVVALFVAAALAAIAIPSYRSYLQRVDVNTAIADISRICLGLEKFRLSEGRLPDSLAEAGFGSLRDPWGNAYEYLNFSPAFPAGAARTATSYPSTPSSTSTAEVRTGSARRLLPLDKVATTS